MTKYFDKYNTEKQVVQVIATKYIMTYLKFDCLHKIIIFNSLKHYLFVLLYITDSSYEFVLGG